MPIRIQNDLPAKAILERENIFVMDENRAMSQDIRPLEILILNLMPLKEDTELQLLRALSNTPLQVNCTFLMTSSHEATHTSSSHINKFYQYFDDIRKKSFDGMIITGAPIEHLEYEEVNYWGEMCRIMEWTKTHVTSTLHLCWGAQAALYYHYGIKKYPRTKKLSGVYRHKVYHHSVPLMRSMDDYFYCPHSRWTELDRGTERGHPEIPEPDDPCGKPGSGRPSGDGQGRKADLPAGTPGVRPHVPGRRVPARSWKGHVSHDPRQLL